MAGAPPLLTNRLFDVLLDALKVAAAVWGAVWMEPWVEQSLPNAGKAIQYLIAALISAFLLELCLQIVFGWPRIKITWSVKGEDAPINEIVARVRNSNPNSQAFSLKISTPPGGWLGYQALRLCMRFGVRLQIRIDRASIVPTCDDSSKVDDVPTIMADNSSHGFVVDLGKAPRRPDQWHSANVRWRNQSTPIGDTFNIDYLFHHDKPLVKFFLNLILRRKTNARFFRVVGP